MLRFVVGHQGGWDEFLMFAIPVAIGVWALRLAERKSRQRAEAEEAESEAARDEDGASRSDAG